MKKKLVLYIISAVLCVLVLGFMSAPALGSGRWTYSFYNLLVGSRRSGIWWWYIPQEIVAKTILFFISILVLLLFSVWRIVCAFIKKDFFANHTPVLFNVLLLLPIILFIILETSLHQVHGLPQMWGYYILIWLNLLLIITAIIMFSFSMHNMRMKRKEKRNNIAKNEENENVKH